MKKKQICDFKIKRFVISFIFNYSIRTEVNSCLPHFNCSFEICEVHTPYSFPFLCMTDASPPIIEGTFLLTAMGCLKIQPKLILPKHFKWIRNVTQAVTQRI